MKMSTRSVLVSIFLLAASVFGQELVTPVMALYSTTNAAQREVAWSTRPGIRYVLQECTNLASNDWTTVAGYPSEAEALAQQHVVELAGASNAFFRVQVLDEQPPEMNSNPDDGDFGVGRFSSVNIDLSDVTGVDSNSISLILGTNSTFSLASSELTWSTNSLVLDLGGDTALGGYGTTQEVTLAVADTLGNSTNYVWSFELEQEIDAATNLFVFGSPDAQRAGQRLSGLSATVAARFNGPVRMSSSSEGWEIDSVTTNEIFISYSTNAPAFEVGQLLANLAPAHESEIFYRRVDSIADNTASNLLTLGTTEVLIGEMMKNGSFSLGDGDAVFLEFDENGTLVSAVDVNATIPLPVIGEDFSGTSLWSSGALDLSLAEGCFTLSPVLKVSLETKGKVVERFEAKLSGDLNISCVPQLTVSGFYSDSISKELWSKTHWYWTSVGFVPVGVELVGSVTANAEIGVEASASLLMGFRQTGELWVAGTYVRGMSPASTMNRGFELDPFEPVPFTYTLDGSGSAVVSLVPQIDCRLYGAAGIYLNTNPRLEVSGSATMVNMEVTEADFRIGAYANINVGLSLIGDLAADLPPLSFNYFTKEWSEHYSNDAEPSGVFIITTQPRSQYSRIGDDVIFSVEASCDSGLFYQWQQDGKNIPGENTKTLLRSRVNAGYAGIYSVRLTSTEMSIISSPAILVISGENNDLEQGVIAHYKFDGNANDSAHILDGSSHGGVTYANGMFGEAASFNGSSSYVKVDSNKIVSDNFTVSTFVKTSADPSESMVLVAYNNYNARYGWGLDMWGSNGGKLRFRLVSSNGGDHRSISVDNTTLDGQWHHVAGVNDGSMLNVYIDGELIDSSPSAPVLWDSSMHLFIGADRPESGVNNDWWLDGQLDETRIYNRALSSAEIATLAGSH